MEASSHQLSLASFHSVAVQLHYLVDLTIPLTFMQSCTMYVASTHLFLAAILWAIRCSRAVVAPSSPAELTLLSYPGLEPELKLRSSGGEPRSRRKRYISSRDMKALLDYHNRVRSQVFPPAANMEYMVVISLFSHQILSFLIGPILP